MAIFVAALSFAAPIYLTAGEQKPDRGAVVARTLASIVRVHVSKCTTAGVATGFLVAPEMVITNRHVVAHATKVDTVSPDGRGEAAHDIWTDPEQDLGVIRVDLLRQPVLPLAADDARTGQWVMTAGFPGGGVATAAIGRVVDYIDDAHYRRHAKVMRITTHVDLGDSGSPVMDEHGAVVGVIAGFEPQTGFAIAIPASGLKPALADAPTTVPANAACPT